MTSRLPRSLYIKSRLVGTPLEEVAKELRWILGARERRKHPELWEIHLEERWLPLILRRLLSDTSCGVDVGSHIGSFLNLLMRYAPMGRHVAFEPSATKSAWLKSRFPRAEVFPYAVAEKAGAALFQEDLARPGYSRLQGAAGASAVNTDNYEVESCCLDDILFERNRVDLIKLDIEGGELAALRGATRAIKRFRPTLLFECGSEYMLEEQKLNRRDLYDFVTRDMGYDVFCFTDFLFDKGAMTFDEFRKCGLYPFRAFNFVALPGGSKLSSSPP